MTKEQELLLRHELINKGFGSEEIELAVNWINKVFNEKTEEKNMVTTKEDDLIVYTKTDLANIIIGQAKMIERLNKELAEVRMKYEEVAFQQEMEDLYK